MLISIVKIDRKIMKKQYLLYIPLLMISTLLLTGCTSEDVPANIDIVNSKSNEGEDKEEGIDRTTSEGNDLGYLSNPKDFSKKKQSIGEKSEQEYTLVWLEDTKQSGYHSFEFEISTDDEQPVLPFVVVEPVLDKGVVRVTVNNVIKDNVGIAYQKSREINLGAITGVYRAVTSQANTAIYEIGYLGENPFSLTYEQKEPNSWIVVVKVAYDLKYSSPNIDFGSTEFSNELQKIEGMSSKDGARISSYSFSVSGDTLKFVFSVASGTSNPIPSVEASYDEQNILEVKFPSLQSDKVSTWGNSISLPAGIVTSVSRGGETSIYRFGGIGASRPFKLSATQSPNQVIVEIKIR
jgi:hypothetical protein